MSLGPNLGDVAGPERPLPPDPKLSPPRAERKPFAEMDYVLRRKRAVAPSPYTRTRRAKKAGRQQAEEQITPPESEAGNGDNSTHLPNVLGNSFISATFS